MTEEIASTSQSEAVTIEKDAATEAMFESFNIKPAASTKEVKFPEKGAETIAENVTEDPAIDQTEALTPAEGKRKVKFNKGEEEVDISTDEKLDDHLQRSLALDKYRDRATQQEKDLDRTAKLLGFKDHAELTSNLEILEKNQQKEQENKFEKDRQKLIDDLVYNGADEAVAIEFIDNNPLIQEGRKAIETQKLVSANQAEASRWSDLYKAFPDLANEVVEGQPTPWYTPEMKAMVDKGYSPKDAYTLLNMNNLQTQTKKQLEQKLIKQQQLGNRSNTLGNTQTEEVTSTLLPAQRALAELFGVSEQGVEKHQKIINSRR